LLVSCVVSLADVEARAKALLVERRAAVETRDGGPCGDEARDSAPRLGLSKKLEDRKSFEIESLKARLELGSSPKRAELEPDLKLASPNEPSSNSSLKLDSLLCIFILDTTSSAEQLLFN
jgi:hypothetical protein